MTITYRFEIVLLLIGVCVALTVVARHLRLPQADALIVGGLMLALVPGMPAIEPDPDLFLFLPPLLLLSAYMTDWRTFRADLRIIAQLAVGAACSHFLRSQMDSIGMHLQTRANQTTLILHQHSSRSSVEQPTFP